MIPVLYALVVLVFAVNFLLGFPKAINLVQTKTFSTNIPNNKIIDIAKASEQVIEVSKKQLPPKNLNLPSPTISAVSAIVSDAKTGFVFYAKDSDKKVPIASTTKIMTAMVGSEYFKPNDILIVPDLAGIDGSTMGLKVGEEITFRSLLYGMLLNSGNDAAFTIAANFPGGTQAFVEGMNNKAIKLGLTNTRFVNPAGFDHPNHFSSAADLQKIATLAMEDNQFARVVGTKETSVASVDSATIHSLKNLNKLLEIPGVLGIKTGTTPQAKENLVALMDRDGHKILTVILGSDDRFGETKALIDWTFSNYLWEQ